jgi:EF-hand domain-containing family member D2
MGSFFLGAQEFKDLSIGELKEYESLFRTYDQDGDGKLDLIELKYMMEKLGSPQTHIALKKMIAEVDEDQDGVMSYREFLLIFRYFKTGKLVSEGLSKIAGSVASVSVGAEGVGGAKNFFESQVRGAKAGTLFC